MSLADQVHSILLDCLFRKEEINDGKPVGEWIKVEGITQNFGIHPGRALQHRETVRQILRQMPDPFWQQRGGGMTFLNLCMDRNDRQWAEHPTMQELVVLAIATKLGGYNINDRDLWRSLPGGMPYVWFNPELP